MIDLPDELILLLLERIGDGNSLLRCRKACRLLYRISFDRLLLSVNFNTININGELLLAEEVINNSELFTTVIEDGKWRQMIDNLIKRQFRQFELLMPDNGVRSIITIILSDNAIYCAAWETAQDIARGNDAWNAAWHAAWTAAWNVDHSGAQNKAWNAARNAARNVICQDVFDFAHKSTEVTHDIIGNTIRNIIAGESDPVKMGQKAWYASEYMYLTNIILDDIWVKVYRLLGEIKLSETIRPFDGLVLQNNIRAIEYKHFSLFREKRKKGK